MQKRNILVTKIIDTLYGRGGFDGWWDDIDCETKNEILNEMETLVGKYTKE